MSELGGSRLTCAELEELAAELALGTLAGDERAGALDHLARCASCRELVDQLGRVADGMLQLAPAAEPPPGFESRVLAGMGVRPASVPRGPSGPRMLLGVAAVALVAALSGAVAATVVDGDRPPEAEVRTALAVDEEGRWTCRAVVYGADPTWLVVSLDRTDGLSTAFSVEALHSGSSVPVPVGTLNIQDGHGTLSAAVGLPAETVKSVRVRDGSGRIRYEVKLPSA